MSGNASPFALTCTSTGSPPTNVVWKKDGSIIAIDGTAFTLTSTVVNRKTSTYKNILTIAKEYVNLLGEFSCAVHNTIGRSTTEIKSLEGKPAKSMLFCEFYTHVCMRL